MSNDEFPIRTIGTRLIVRRKPVRQGTIVIPNAAKPDAGTVVAKGDGVTDLSVGDVIHWKKYAGTEIFVNGEAYSVIKADDVLAREVGE